MGGRARARLLLAGCSRSNERPAPSHARLPAGVLTLAAYLNFWGWAYLAITAAVALLTCEPTSGGHRHPATLPAAGSSNDRGRRRSARLAAAVGTEPPAAAAAKRDGGGAGASNGSSGGGGWGGEEHEAVPLGEAYQQLWGVVKLPAVQVGGGVGGWGGVGG